MEKSVSEVSGGVDSRARRNQHVDIIDSACASSNVKQGVVHRTG